VCRKNCEVAKPLWVTPKLIDIREPHSDLEVKVGGSEEVCRRREQPVGITKEFASGLCIPVFDFTQSVEKPVANVLQAVTKPHPRLLFFAKPADLGGVAKDILDGVVECPIVRLFEVITEGLLIQ